MVTGLEDLKCTFPYIHTVNPQKLAKHKSKTHCKKKISQHFFFVKSTLIIYLVQITYYFEFLSDE